MTEETQRQRENVGMRKKPCSRCGVLCCECCVRRGYPPAEWHPGCMAAARRAQKGPTMSGL
jgi:hypothetical protein